MMDQKLAWELFERTGRIDAYMTYRMLLNSRETYPEGEDVFDADQNGWNRDPGGVDI